MRPAEPILHIDMDAFYAAVEVARDPSLAGRPVLVGGSGGRGVVASASYEARRFGVTSAMPMREALRRCPAAVVRPPNFDAYRAVSDRLRALLDDLTPLVEPVSIDEAFCDVGGAGRLFGTPEQIGADLRARVREELGLDACVGVAPNKFLAKLASQKAKPRVAGPDAAHQDLMTIASRWPHPASSENASSQARSAFTSQEPGAGVLVVRADAVEAFLHPLDVRDLWGVGERTAQRLGRAGLRTVADVAAVAPAVLQRLVGDAAGAHLAELARGHDPRPVTPEVAAKQLSAEQTFASDITDAAHIRTALLDLTERVTARLRGAGLVGRTVTVKVRAADFTTRTRSRTLACATAETAVVHEAAVELTALARTALGGQALRLLGVGVSGLRPAGSGAQLALLDDVGGRVGRWRYAERAADTARERFGETAVTRGALLRPPDGQ